MKFSIAIPAYKSQYLKQAITSVLSQKTNDFELIILNDKSPYDIDSIVKEFKDERIRYYINKKNVGAVNVVDNWNTLLQYARGDFFLMMGDDDELSENCLLEYINLIGRHPDLEVYHGRTLLIDEYSKPVVPQDARPEFESFFSAVWHRMIGRQQFIGDYLFNTSALKALGGFVKLPLAWGTDDLTVFKLSTEKGIANTNELIFRYRINPFSITSSGNSDIKMDAVNEHRKMLSDLINQGKELDSCDNILKVCIKKKTKGYFQKKKAKTMADDFYSNGLFRFLHWYFNRKRYDVSFSLIVYGVIECIKTKKSNK